MRDSGWLLSVWFIVESTERASSRHGPTIPMVLNMSYHYSLGLDELSCFVGLDVIPPSPALKSSYAGP